MAAAVSLARCRPATVIAAAQQASPCHRVPRAVPKRPSTGSSKGLSRMTGAGANRTSGSSTTSTDEVSEPLLPATTDATSDDEPPAEQPSAWASLKLYKVRALKGHLAPQVVVIPTM